jgi:hypothetical protein
MRQGFHLDLVSPTGCMHCHRRLMTVRFERVGMSNVTFDGDRLWSSLMDTARIGAASKGDIKRLTLTDEDRQVLEAILDFDSTLESRTVSA